MVLNRYVKNYIKIYMKSYVKSYMHCSKYGLVIVLHVGLVFGFWFWGVLGMHLFCTMGASCEVVVAAG